MKNTPTILMTLGLVLSLSSLTAQAYLPAAAQVIFICLGAVFFSVGLQKTLRKPAPTSAETPALPEPAPGMAALDASSPKKTVMDAKNDSQSEAERQETTATVGAHLSALLQKLLNAEEEQLFDTMLQGIMQSTRAKTAAFYQFDGSRLWPQCQRGVTGELQAIFTGQGPIGEAFSQKKVVYNQITVTRSAFSGLGSNPPAHCYYLPLQDQAQKGEARGVIALALEAPLDEVEVDQLLALGQILGSLTLWDGQDPAWKAQLAEAETALKRRDEALRHAQGEIHAWEEKASDLTARCHQLENRVSELKSTTPEPLTQEFLEEMAELKTRIIEAQSQVKQLNQENQRLEQHLERAQAATQGSAELNDYIEKLEGRLERLDRELEESRHKEAGYKEAFNRVRQENIGLHKSLREKVPEGDALQQEFADLKRRHHRVNQLSERRADEIEALRKALESEMLKMKDLSSKQTNGLKSKIADLEAQLAAENAKNQTLDAQLTAIESESQGLHDRESTLSTARLALQRQVDDLVGERTQLLARVDELDRALLAWQHAVEERDGLIAELRSAELLITAGAISQEGGVLPILEALSLPALHIDGQGMVSGATRALSTLLDMPIDQILGTDEWSFTTEILMPRAEDAATLRKIQAGLLDGAKPGQTDLVNLHGQPPLHRWLVPLGAGPEDGRLEIYAPLSSAQEFGMVTRDSAHETLQTIQGLLTKLDQVRVMPTPVDHASPSTTLQALLRQLDEMGQLMANPGADTVELRARISTARALIGNLLNRDDLSQYASRAAVAERKYELTAQLAKQLRALETHLLA